MNCRTFHRYLEDYLEDALDFAGRFGMERHARECIGCEKELARAQHLHQMTSELERVKAPSNLESSVLTEIGRRKSHGRFRGIQGYWTYGPFLPSWQKLALASSGLVVLVLGITFLSHRTIPDERVSAPAQIAVKPERLETEAISVPIIETDRPPLKKTAAEEIPKLAKAVRSRRAPERDIIQNLEPMETEYVEYMMMGQDNRPVPIRLPKRIRMQYGLTSEDAFIRNVSH